MKENHEISIEQNNANSEALKATRLIHNISSEYSTKKRALDALETVKAKCENLCRSYGDMLYEYLNDTAENDLAFEFVQTKYRSAFFRYDENTLDIIEPTTEEEDNLLEQVNEHTDDEYQIKKTVTLVGILFALYDFEKLICELDGNYKGNPKKTALAIVYADRIMNKVYFLKYLRKKGK